MKDLNLKQTIGLSNFFFDVAKGLFLGGVGSVVVAPLELKVLSIFASMTMAYVCVKMGLSLLEEN